MSGAEMPCAVERLRVEPRLLGAGRLARRIGLRPGRSRRAGGRRRIEARPGAVLGEELAQHVDLGRQAETSVLLGRELLAQGRQLLVERAARPSRAALEARRSAARGR